MAPETLQQIIALIQSHRQTLISNTQMTTVGEIYLQDYENYVNDLERESGENLQRFRIPHTAIQSRLVGTQTFDEYSGERTSNNRRERFCAKPYFLGQLDALLAYLKAPPPEWPSQIG